MEVNTYTSEKDEFDTLPQADSVQVLLNAAIAAFKLLPIGAEKDKLGESIKNFENTVVQLTWHIEDVRNLFPNVSDEDAQKILYMFSSNFEISDSDWFSLEWVCNEYFEIEN
ncbi:hypothetical protein [Neisseria sp. Ec49-e6-T10]|uniref:hypothetical protein n=1 Tax=Neisseria sp. Ec49-e6-T10 TaxID=3140744 RepID=UPI003EBEC802